MRRVRVFAAVASIGTAAALTGAVAIAPRAPAGGASIVARSVEVPAFRELGWRVMPDRRDVLVVDGTLDSGLEVHAEVQGDAALRSLLAWAEMAVKMDEKYHLGYVNRSLVGSERGQSGMLHLGANAGDPPSPAKRLSHPISGLPPGIRRLVEAVDDAAVRAVRQSIQAKGAP